MYCIFKVARVRRHGFSEREVSLVRALLMADIESAYLERDQMQSTNLREEYLQVGISLCFNFIVVLSCEQFALLVPKLSSSLRVIIED